MKAGYLSSFYKILDLSQAIAASGSQEDIVDTLAQGLNEIMTFDTMGIYVLNGAVETLQPRRILGERWQHVNAEDWTLPAGKGIIGAVIQSGKPELVNHAHQDARAFYPDNIPFRKEHMMIFPIKQGAACWGTILVNRLDEHIFTQEEFQATEFLAAFASMALTNIKLIQDLKQNESAKQAVIEAIPDTIYMAFRKSRTIIFQTVNGDEAKDPITEYLGSHFLEEILNTVSQGVVKTVQFTLSHQEFPTNWETRLVPLSSAMCLVIVRDLSEINITRIRLEQSESLKRVIVDTLSDGVISVNNTGKIVFANDSIQRIFGYTIQELKDQPLEMLIPQDLRHLHHNSFSSYVSTGTKKMHRWDALELIGLHRDGRKIPIEVSFGETNLRGTHLFTGIIRDISERKEADQQLKSTSSRLTTLIQNMQSAVLVEDENRRIVLCNHQFCKLFHIPAPPESLVGADCSSAAEQSKQLFASPDDFVSEISELLRQQQAALGQEVLMADGTVLERDYIPIFVDKTYRGHMWLYRDVTERKRVQQHIMRLASLTEESPHPIVRVNCSFMVEDSNQAGKKFLCHQDERYTLHPRWHATVKQCLSEKHVLEEEYFDDAEQRFYLIHFTPAPSGFVNIYGREITELKRTEQDLLRAKSLAEESMRSKQEFLAKMSHELRTPINGVLGLTNLILGSDDVQQNHEYLMGIKTSGEQLLSVINDILDLAKIESGKLVLEKIPFQPLKVIRSLVNNFKPLAREKGIELVAQPDMDMPEVLLGDPVRLNQILLNLVSNAIKFTEHGRVTIASSALEHQQQIWLEFSVSDTGIGIPPDKKEKIFESFTQAEDHITRNYGGTGLGLSIVKQLVELQGGSIHVESALEHGSTFTFTIPYERSRASVREERGHQENPWDDIQQFQGQRILVAEDNAINQIIVKQTLERMNLHPTLVNNGQEALDMLARERFDLIIMDIQMPVMDGLTATGKIRAAKQSWSAVPIMAMTASVLNEAQGRVTEAGMDDYIPKPFKLDMLYQKLSRWFTPGKAQASVSEKSFLNLHQLNEICVHDTEGVQNLLKKLAKLFQDSILKLHAIFERRDAKVYREEIHKLKGTLGLIGSDELHRQSAALEASVIKTHVIPEREHQEFIKSFQVLVKEVNQKIEI